MLIPVYERSFVRDLEKAKKRGKAMEKLMQTIDLLLTGKPLPAKYKDHKLKGNLKNCRECHIEPDWLLVYMKTTTEIILLQTGTHSDLF
jgi:mRNA interferase YafQ